MASRVSILAGILVGSALVAHAPAQDAGEGAAARVKLKAMRMVADEVVLEAGPTGSRVKVERIADPIYRYVDPPRVADDGSVWAWGRPGRPVALLTIASEKPPSAGGSWLCEWTSLSSGRLAVVGPGPRIWEPSAAGVELLPVPDAPPPGETPEARAKQMAGLRRRFKGSECFRGPDDRPTDRIGLRLLPRPAHRYADPGAGLVDGAIFFFAAGTNPEIALLIEARREGTSPAAWTYGMARLAGAELHAELDGAEVWTRPLEFSPPPRAPYFITFRPMQAAD